MMCPQRRPSLHQVPPAESLLKSGAPSRVPPYIRCPQRSPSVHQVPPAESLLTSGSPIEVPPYIRCPQRIPSLHQVPPAESLGFASCRIMHDLISAAFTEDQLAEGKKQEAEPGWLPSEMELPPTPHRLRPFPQ
ncbi:hypothetical protein AB205_0036920, partial [Aquarana catesbeiana]